MKNSKGLRNATDAIHYCKSMQKGGPQPIIKSMKSYEVGGVMGVQMNDSADPGRKIRKAIRKVKNAFKNSGGGHTPTYHKPKCGGVGCYN
jgi:ribosomal protein L21E